jgi:hypothetical protein
VVLAHVSTHSRLCNTNLIFIQFVRVAGLARKFVHQSFCEVSRRRRRQNQRCVPGITGDARNATVCLGCKTITRQQSKASKCVYTRARKSLRYSISLSSSNKSNKEAFNVYAIRSLSDSFVSKAQDIEEMVGLGNKLNSCPYYASRCSFSPSPHARNPLTSRFPLSSTSRQSVPLAQVVFVP